MKIAIASENKGKIAEFKAILEPLGYEIIPASELGVDMSPLEETGETFAQNAKLKSEYLFNKTNMPSLADDSGLVINALPDILGVKSARFMGENTSYDVKHQEILRLLSDKKDRSAYFESAISLTSATEQEIFSGQVHGKIALEPMGHKGFGYDPIFMPEGYGITFGLIDGSIKNKISHRAKSLQAFSEYLNEK